MSLEEANDILNTCLDLSDTVYGAWKNECPLGNYISDFTAISPKNYCLVIRDCVTNDITAEVIKVKGFTLRNEKACQLINEKEISKLIEAMQKSQHSSLAIPQFQIKINKKTFQLHAKELKKMYKNFALHEMKRFLAPEQDKKIGRAHV